MEEVTPSDRSIWLSASISPSATTRTAYELTTPTTEKTFDAMVWASTTSCNYPYNSADPKTGADNTMGYHTTVYFQSGTDQLLRDGLVYPPNNADVYFIGLYPNAGWEDKHDGSSNISTSFTFNGSNDVLYAPQVSGNLSASVALPTPTKPQLHFFHLLTYLRVKVFAEDASVASSWGKLTNLKLMSQQKSLTIDLRRVPDISSGDFATMQSNVEAIVTFSALTPEDIPFYARGTDTAFNTYYPSGKDISDVSTEVAYVLCKPVSASEGSVDSRTNEYVLELSTQNRTAVTINVDLKTASDTWFTGSTMGHEFVIELKLCAGGYISASASVTDWTTGGYVITDVTE
jgi:hypothetical protein